MCIKKTLEEEGVWYSVKKAGNIWVEDDGYKKKGVTDAI